MSRVPGSKAIGTAHNKVIRGIDRQLWIRLRRECIAQDVTVGDALNAAIRAWLGKNEVKTYE